MLVRRTAMLSVDIDRENYFATGVERRGLKIIARKITGQTLHHIVHANMHTLRITQQLKHPRIFTAVESRLVLSN